MLEVGEMAHELMDIAGRGVTLGKEEGYVECKGVGQVEHLRGL